MVPTTWPQFTINFGKPDMTSCITFIHDRSTPSKSARGVLPLDFRRVQFSGPCLLQGNAD